MTRSPLTRLVLAALTLVVSAAATLDGRAPTARERYETAQRREAEARAAVERVTPGAPTDELDRVVRPARRVVTDYEGVVRRFPTSGYSDNALMQAATLSQHLYARFGRAADRVAAQKYFDWLVREYPASPLRRQARAAVRALDTIVPASEKTPPTRTAAAPAATAATAASTTNAAAPTVATLRAIERAVLDSTVRITLALDRETPFSHEVLDGPPRAFVDLFGATATEPLQDTAIRYDAGAVRQVRVGRRTGAVRVVLDLEGATPVSVFTLYNPYRVVIDAERPAAARPRELTTAGPAAPMPAPAATTAVIPAAAAPPAAVAVAVAPPAAVVPVTVEAGPDVRLVDERDADLSPRPAPPEVDEFVPAPGFAVPPAAAPAAAPTAAVAPALPAVVARGAVGVEPLPAPAPDPPPARLPVLPSTPAPTVPAANTDGSFSLARQLGLGISRIVIDAGHGGHDPGTLTTGTNEARLVLDVALRLEKLLVKDGFDVVLTRRTDVFIPLEQRTAIANREGADLFLSIHANAGRDPKARGIEVYYLSFASNPEAEAVAARENATAAGGMHNLPGIVRAIALNNKLDESRDLAAMVQQSLTARLSKTNVGIRNRGVKKAPFVVLIGAQMPSILAEIGFITNRQEVALIKTPAYRQKIAESLQAAVVQYQRSLKRQSAVATR
jgi:N-acetylmuramoyl-L-alanine amidase